MNKRKIINDPVYGFINIASDLLYDIIEHPYFQRLRRIKQLGIAYFVYPGATHNRFHHVLGATHLMSEAIEVLRSKNHKITDEEAEAVLLAILLHDIGHGPFSHILENSFVQNISHEDISLIFMLELNKKFNGKLNLCIEIYTNQYNKKFLHQLVSSQLDMDRLDYLRRDSFYTGVSEGVIGIERIIKMLTVKKDELVVEAKGIYSIENFLIARRLMYWQVYLHKTVVAAEQMLVKILKRAKYLASCDQQLFSTPALNFFLYNTIDEITSFIKYYNNNRPLDFFADLDDNDVFTAIKMWRAHPDKILAFLCQNLINRKLFKIEVFPSKREIYSEYLNELKIKASRKYQIPDYDIDYIVFTGKIGNNAYTRNKEEIINILYKDGRLVDIANASDISNVKVLSKRVVKYFLCYPKDLEIED